MAFDFKKEYKEFYMPKNKPGIVTVPSMNYIAVQGQGDPNQEDGEYKQSIALLYGIAFMVSRPHVALLSSASADRVQERCKNLGNSTFPGFFF